MIGAGKYDDVCTFARLATGARGAVLLIIEGRDGRSFSAQLPQGALAHVAGALRKVADQMEADEKRVPSPGKN